MADKQRLYASCGTDPEHLTARQENAVNLLLRRIETIITDLRDPSRQQTGGDLQPGQPLPHHVFLLDGPRGGGKSYTLATIEALLKALSDKGARTGFDTTNWLENAGVKMGSEGAFSPSKRSAAHVMRVIFPGDMENGDSLMEAVLAGVRDSLQTELNEFARDQSDGGREAPPQRGPLRQQKVLAGLLPKLREIAQGWYYAHQFGLDAIIRDSVDYGDLVTKFEKESGRAANRAAAWRKFVHEYLDAIEAETLVVMLDDSDAGPELTADILQSTRMFLSHPRIITILAGNLDSMRGSLIQSAMDRLSSAIGSLGSTENRTARDWRRGHRLLIEEYLDKVLPPANRLYLKPLGKKLEGFDIIGEMPLDKYIESGFKMYRQSFLDVKFRLALGREISERDAPTDLEERRLESYLAWWFFSDRYRAHLAPRTPRQIATFRDFYRDLGKPVAPSGGAGDMKKTDGDAKPLPTRPKRLAVALFQNPANYLLIQRLADSDDSIPEWLRQQMLESSWHGRRLFKINNRELEENGYPHRYLRYRLDVGLGLPIRDNVQAAVPDNLLPRPAGRQLMRRFLQARDMPRRPRSLGLSRWIDHAALPANCLYFHDLEALPDIAFLNTAAMKPREIEKYQSGEWESFLSSRIYDIIDDRHSAMNVDDDQGDDEAQDNIRSDDQQRALKDEYVFRYVREIVCESLRFSQEVKSATLMAELDPADITLKQTKAIYEHFIRFELDSFIEDVAIRCEGWWSAFGGVDVRADTKERADVLRLLKKEEEQKRQAEEAKRRQRKEIEDFWNDLQNRLAAIRSQQTPEEQAALETLLDSLAEKFNSFAPAREATDSPLALPDASSPAIRQNQDYRRAVALYCCLFTDLRRAWHAVRIHEAAPSLQPDDDESATHASLAALTNRDRMPLYTRRQIRALLERSRWTKAVLSVFSLDAVRDVVGTKFQEQADASNEPLKSTFTKEDLERIYTATDITLAPRDSVSNPMAQAQPLAEKADFKNWTQTLRNIGRAVCDKWPVHDLDYKDTGALEEAIFARAQKKKSGKAGTGDQEKPLDARINVFRRDTKGGELTQDELRLQRSNARQARKLVWLLHGFAPSLPAIIHSEIMGIVYQASLLKKAAADARFLGEAQEELEAAADNLLKDANAEITAWAVLIGTLSVVLRYVKIKALHLDISFILREALRSLESNKTEDKIRRTELRELLRVCGYEKLFDTNAYDMNGVVRKLIRAFEGTDTVEEKTAMNVELSTFPDVAPSTLFGERWVKDLLDRKGLKQKISEKPVKDDQNIDSGISVNGMFGETEQWLWTANRGLRKLRAVLKEWKWWPEEFKA